MIKIYYSLEDERILGGWMKLLGGTLQAILLFWVVLGLQETIWTYRC